jgi:hypothetical protein
VLTFACMRVQTFIFYGSRDKRLEVLWLSSKLLLCGCLRDELQKNEGHYYIIGSALCGAHAQLYSRLGSRDKVDKPYLVTYISSAK